MTSADHARMSESAAQTQHYLDFMRERYGPDAASAFAGGAIAGARNYLIMHHGRRATYNMLAQITDDTITIILPK